MRLGILEDDELFVNEFRNDVRKWGSVADVNVEVIWFRSPEQLIRSLDEEDVLDAVFLDIVLDEDDSGGFKAAQTIRKRNETMPIVFLTVSHSYLQMGYHVDALRYLLKPLNENDLIECLCRINQEYDAAYSDSMVVRMRREQVRVRFSDIIYISASRNHCDIHLSKRIINCQGTLTEIAELLPPEFVRIHRSIIANVRHVESVLRNEIIVDSQECLPVSRSRRAAIQRAFASFA